MFIAAVNDQLILTPLPPNATTLSVDHNVSDLTILTVHTDNERGMLLYPKYQSYSCPSVYQMKQEMTERNEATSADVSDASINSVSVLEEEPIKKTFLLLSFLIFY